MKINELLTEVVKQRLDPKCWKGKHKEGTKIKGGVRVNNCVPNESQELNEYIVRSGDDISSVMALNLFKDLQKEFNLTYVFIAHDLGVVRYVSDRIAVMYLGKVVELAPAEDLYQSPAHPYTKALLSANPRMDGDDKRERIILKGDIPNPINRPDGCVFNPRCPKVQDICRTNSPELIQIGAGQVACHFPEN
jgi:oligopeptide/dipeptide ABC transporter ATP-binding protein